MLRPAITQLISKNDSYYSLVIGVAKRAREIANELFEDNKTLEEKPVKTAVEEFAAGRYKIMPYDKAAEEAAARAKAEAEARAKEEAMTAVAEQSTEQNISTESVTDMGTGMPDIITGTGTNTGITGMSSGNAMNVTAMVDSDEKDNITSGVQETATAAAEPISANTTIETDIF